MSYRCHICDLKLDGDDKCTCIDPEEFEYLQSRIEKLKEENKKLRECVEFYADHNNYIDEESCGYPILVHKEQLNSGMKARKTLKELEGEK